MLPKGGVFVDFKLAGDLYRDGDPSNDMQGPTGPIMMKICMARENPLREGIDC